MEFKTISSFLQIEEIKMMNADCILHAALEEDKEMVNKDIIPNIFLIKYIAMIYEGKQRIYISKRTDRTPLRLPNVCPPNLSPGLLCHTVG